MVMSALIKPIQKRAICRIGLLGAALILVAANVAGSLPKGLMLNLDFGQLSQGLAPSMTLYPLHVPIGDLEAGTADGRTVLVLKEDQGLDIPHSLLLNPDGNGWVTSIRLFALSDGMVMSQCNDRQGYAIYIEDGAVHVALQAGHSTLILEENTEQSTTDCLNKWVSIELIMKHDVALLLINRMQVALIALDAPLNGNDFKIRIGAHETAPTPLARRSSVNLSGFSGAVSSVKMIRR